MNAGHVISGASDWYRAVTRANKIFDVDAVIKAYRNGLKELGSSFEHQVFTYKDGFVAYFRSRAEIESQLTGPLLTAAGNIEHIQELARASIDSFHAADELIAAAGRLETFEDVRGEAERIYTVVAENIKLGTIIPYMVLNAIDRAGFTSEEPGPYREVFTLYEPIRADSRILAFGEHLYPVIWKILADKFNIYDQTAFMALTGREFLDICKNGRVPSGETLSARQNGCVGWYDSDTHELAFSTDPNLFNQVSEFGADAVDASADSFAGVTAQQGIARGKVRILYTFADTPDFEDGDIVVSTSTSPVLMPYLIRSGGIITDEGGISSHAAIISRELKKPCIMGTKVATKILKNGDTVELNADEGYVKITERASS